MLKIAIVDDKINICFQVEEYIEKVCSELNLNVEVDVYESGETLLKALSQQGLCYDLIFLDIELKTTTGIKVGKVIRDEYNDEFTQIVYISWKADYAVELFDINPFNFLIKPLNYEKINKVIRRYLKISGFWSDVFTYKYGHDTFKIKLKDIKYFKSDGRKIMIYLKDKIEEYYDSLDRIYSEQLIKYDFLFIHKSYIVNYDCVSEFGYERLVLNDKTVLPIGRTRRKEVIRRQSEIEKRRF